MSFLNMLGSFKAVPNEKKTRTGGNRKQWNPTTADLRIFKDGSVFPSQQLVDDFNLEYQRKDFSGLTMGLDVIDSRKFPNTASFATPFLMVAPTDKKAGKVDLFNSCTYNDDGTPVTSVMDQGSNSFGKDLLSTLKEVYGVTVDVEIGYIDLSVIEEEAVATELATVTNGIYNIPKNVNRGDKKGTQTYVRRENLAIYVLIPTSFLNDGANLADNDGQVTKTTTNATVVATR